MFVHKISVRGSKFADFRLCSFGPKLNFLPFTSCNLEETTYVRLGPLQCSIHRNETSCQTKDEFVRELAGYLNVTVRTAQA